MDVYIYMYISNNLEWPRVCTRQQPRSRTGPHPIYQQGGSPTGGTVCTVCGTTRGGTTVGRISDSMHP